MSRCPEPSAWAALDVVDRAARLTLLEHARGCAGCRERLLAEDPAHLFSLLALRPVPAATLARVSASVTAALDAGRIPAARLGRRAAVTGWAAAALLALVVASRLLGPRGVPASDDDPAQLAFTLSNQGATRAGVELLAAPGAARVVDLAVGETQVVMIFDERLDL